MNTSLKKKHRTIKTLSPDDIWQPLFNRAALWAGFLDKQDCPCRYPEIGLCGIEFDGDCATHEFFVNGKATIAQDSGFDALYVHDSKVVFNGPPYGNKCIEIKEYDRLRVCCSAVYRFLITAPAYFSKDGMICSRCGVLQKRRDRLHTVCESCFLRLLEIPTFKYGVYR